MIIANVKWVRRLDLYCLFANEGMKKSIVGNSVEEMIVWVRSFAAIL